MPKFRDVEFPDLVEGCEGDCLSFEDAGDGNIIVASRDADRDMNIYNYLTPEQQDELWRRIGEARGLLQPTSARLTPPWRDLPGGEG